MSNRVHQLRLVVTVEDYDDALHFYRDVLGLPEREAFASQGGRPVAGHVRVAFQVDDTPAVTAELAVAGAHVLAEPTRTPWNSLNARLAAPKACS
jgi:lactoylglutathione lyase